MIGLLSVHLLYVFFSLFIYLYRTTLIIQEKNSFESYILLLEYGKQLPKVVNYYFSLHFLNTNLVI